MSEILYYLPEDVPDLARATDGASGFDLRAYFGIFREVADEVAPGDWRRYNTGLHLAMPPGVEAQCRPRSGLAFRHGVTVLNAPGTIDADYRGENTVVLINHGPTAFRVEHGDRVAQIVFAPVLLPVPAHWAQVWRRDAPYPFANLTIRRVPSLADLPSSARGDASFGSTGVR